MAAPLFFYSNLLQTTPAAVMAVSSELASLPRGNLLTQRSSVRWRSKAGWTITAGVNDRILFTRAANLNAQIAAGYYATGALLAVAIVAALEAIDAAPVWACDYGVTVVDKFTISSNIAFVLNTGTANFTGAELDLGYALGADTSNAVTHTADNVSYQSRHWVHVDLGSALAAMAAIVRGHNVSTAGTVRMDGSNGSMVAAGLLVGIGTYTVTLAGTSDPRIVLFASNSKRYLRLVIEDVQNRVGYAELGVWFAGPYSTSTISPSVQYSKQNEHLSEIRYADGGAQDQVLRTRRRVYKLLFQLEERASLAVADRALFDAIDALGIGTNLFLQLDVLSDATITVYGFNLIGLHEMYDRGTLWAIVMEFAEALG